MNSRHTTETFFVSQPGEAEWMDWKGIEDMSVSDSETGPSTNKELHPGITAVGSIVKYVPPYDAVIEQLKRSY